jgi:tetratricopeptide (TPR) repeat protein
MILILMIALSSGASDLKGIYTNNLGVTQLSKDQNGQAQKSFADSLTELPNSNPVHLNMGLSFYKAGDKEKAEKSFKMALKNASSAEEKFFALYNLGELAQTNKNRDLALSFYQQALEFDPKNKEVKTNIELMIQQQKQQQSGGGGQDQQNKDQKQDQQDQKQSESGDNKDDKGKEGQENKPKQYAPNGKQKQEFKSQNLSQSDVNKILGEIKQQESKIRAEYSKKEAKERPNGKDW